MWFTRLLLIVFVVIVILVLHDIRRILEMQNELLKEQYIMRGEMNLIMDIALKNPYTQEPEDKTMTVEVEL